MEFCCTRVSDECVDFLDKPPHELNQSSLYELVDDACTISKIHRSLLDSCNSNSLTGHQLLSHNAFELLTIANGSPTLKCQLQFKSRSEIFDAQFYLGGGLGCDLMTSTQLNQAYIVCLVSKSVAPSPPVNDKPLQTKKYLHVLLVCPTACHSSTYIQSTGLVCVSQFMGKARRAANESLTF
jgi:hypothetical protein